MRSRWLIILITAICVCLTTSPVLAGNIVIKGSTTVLPIAQKVAEAYMKENPDVSITISGGGSGNGIKAIIDGTTDIADSSRFIKDKEVKLALERGAYPVPFAVAYDCIVPAVHPSNPVKNITMDQLQAIYMGKIKNWKSLGGVDKRSILGQCNGITRGVPKAVWDRLSALAEEREEGVRRGTDRHGGDRVLHRRSRLDEV